MNSYILPLDKPVGPTSHDIVTLARRALGTRRIGHTGTLDPFASGLLLLCVGNATRLAEYLSDLPKTYRAVARFDGTMSTDDRTGDLLVASAAWQALDPDRVRAAFELQRGTIQQRPSAFSAKKVHGERAYELARRGEPVELAPSEVTIYDIRIRALQLPEVSFEVDCSSGTYVRAIARDVGELLGTGGYLTELRRTRNGPFGVEDALPADALDNVGRVHAQRVSMLDAVPQLARVVITEDEERALRFGQAIARREAPGTLALARDGELIAIGTADGERISPKKVFPRD
jgi:tRNA pseudouridine55 synthase